MAVALGDLLAAWPALEVVGDVDVSVTAVAEDSREVVAGGVFVAVDGHGADGHLFVSQAVASGAAVVVVDRDRLTDVRAALPSDLPLTWVMASCTRGLPARLAREFEGRPDTALTAVGVTGTNGKTTCTFLLQALLGQLVGSAGLLGTIRYDDGQTEERAPLTTPGGPVLYRWLARMRDAGCRAVALEISSHALDQQRPGDLALDAAVLTNLGRDHLDYHGDLAAYLDAKARILDLVAAGPHRGKGPGIAVVNVGDPSLAALAGTHHPTVGFSTGASRADADLQLRRADLTLSGTRLELDWRGQRLELESPLVGRFNVENLTAALATGLALGYDPDRCVDGLAKVGQVPGRMERISLPTGALAVVDYAHTHDALAAVLTTCRELVQGRLIVVFGCGGDRDRGKRPLMGRVAAEQADRVWVTSDNPRSEDPQAICDDVVAGLNAAARSTMAMPDVVVDRRTAIEEALADARDGDVVVIAGKGHEDYQLVGDRVLHFDDRDVVRDWIAREDDDA